jgi:cold shock protein
MSVSGRMSVERIAVERAGMRDVNEGQKISYDVVADRRTGKSSADNLKPA